VQKVLRSGRVAESWLGATKEVAKRVSSTSVQGGLIDRNGRLPAMRVVDWMLFSWMHVDETSFAVRSSSCSLLTVSKLRNSHVAIHTYPPQHTHSHTRTTGRYDLRLPDYVIEQLGLVEALQPILTRLEGIMGTPKPQLRTHNVVFVPVGE